MFAVAARFGFSENEMLEMPLSRLMFWRRGHDILVAEERATAAQTMSAMMKGMQ